ncbi:hypothetical protein GCM10023237_66210 [Streptomyces coeruleoprunus]
MPSRTSSRTPDAHSTGFQNIGSRTGGGEDVRVSILAAGVGSVRNIAVSVGSTLRSERRTRFPLPGDGQDG